MSRLVARPPGSVFRTDVTITGTATDAQIGVESVLVSLDGGAPQSLDLNSSGNFYYTTKLSLNRSADGPHTLDFTATDTMGKSTVASVSFKLDTTSPSLTLTSPSSGLAFKANPTIAGTVSGSGKPRKWKSFVEQLDGGPLTPLQFNAVTGTFSFQPNLALNGTADGPHTVQFQAVDKRREHFHARVCVHS